MRIAINKAHFPVTVLGPGRRIGIWVQGCSIHCKGCVSQDTWAPDPSRETTVPKLLAWCRKISGGAFDGITISGGEPFDQPKALGVLLDGFIRWRADQAGAAVTGGADFDLLCYSGYPLATLQKRHAALLDKLDAIIPEPFVETLPLDRLWRGSSNQALVPLSARGRARYGQYVDAPADTFGKRIQAGIDGDRVWFVGIPARGDMAALEAKCAERGIELKSVSWRH